MFLSSKKSIRLLSLLLTVLLLSGVLSAASFAADRSSVIDWTAYGSLTLTMIDQSTYEESETRSPVLLSGCTFALYRVAKIDETSPTLKYDLLSPFTGAAGVLDDVTTNAKIIAAAETLESYISGTAYKTGTTGSDGKVQFGDLELGVYLIVQTDGPDNYDYSVPLLAFIPSTVTDADGSYWEYDIDAYPKVEKNTTYITVIKEWDDSGYTRYRPDYVTVYLYQDDTQYDTVRLESSNDWTYTWSDLNSDSDWTVEENVSSRYDVDYSTSFTSDGGVVYTITNTYDYDPPDSSPTPSSTTTVTTPSTPTLTEIVITPTAVPLEQITDAETPLEEIPDEEVPLAAPQTGLLQWPIPVLLALGALLVIVGLIDNRRKKKDAK